MKKILALVMAFVILVSAAGCISININPAQPDDENVEQEINKGRARLVILTGDIGTAVSKKLREGCEKRHIPLIDNGDRERLSHAAGKEDRSCFAVTDEGFAAALVRLLAQETQEPQE